MYQEKEIYQEIDQEKETDLSELENMLIEMWEGILKVEGIDIDDNFFKLGADSVAVARFTTKLQEKLGQVVHLTVTYKKPTVRQLAQYIADSYENAVFTIFGRHLGKTVTLPLPELTESDVANIRTAFAGPRLAERVSEIRRDGAKQRRNGRAVFVLCSPRSGSTLLRVMLGGHPKLFAPPELVLLSFRSLKHRKTVLSGYQQIWLEGVIRAVMEIKQCEGIVARELVERCEEEDLSVQEFYGLMQDWLGGKILVDKSPTYAQNIEALQHAEEYFEDPLYIHLLRHPTAMIRSYEEQRMDQLNFRERQGYKSRQVAELVWLVTHRNIIDFFKEIPEERQHRVVFEELVKQPRAVMEDVCEFLGLDFDEGVLTPYQDKSARMTDGPRPSSKMLGDPKFHKHSGIDPNVADRWKQEVDIPVLSRMTWDLAETLGYQRER